MNLNKIARHREEWINGAERKFNQVGGQGGGGRDRQEGLWGIEMATSPINEAASLGQGKGKIFA